MAKRGQSKYMPHMRTRRTDPVGGHSGLSLRGASHSRHERMQVKAQTNELKGKRGGDCNRTQCQRPNAWWYNRTMQAYYCGSCAAAINESCLHKDHIASFGSMVYVKPPTLRMDEVNGKWHVSLTTADSPTAPGDVVVCDTKDEAEDELRELAWMADLRSDGTPPLHYSELRDKMLRNRAAIQERYPDLAMVDFV